MTWKLTAWAKTRHPIAGVPWRDLTDEEFAAAEAKFPKGALKKRGYFEHEPEATEKRQTRKDKAEEVNADADT